MLLVRSVLFTAVLFSSGIFGSAVVLLFFWAPFRFRWAIAVAWADFSLWAGKLVTGLDVTTEGKENIQEAPAVYLIKHTTAMETYWQIAELPPSAWVLKRELFYVPIFGWALWLMNSIGIDRRSSGSAVKQVIAQGKQRIESGLSMCIFPEGTRMPRGESRRYGISGAALAKEVGCMIVPVAHNAGDFWPRRGWRKRPGRIRFCIGPPIDPKDLSAKEANRVAQEWVESKMLEISRIYQERAQVN
jgi:1-acyl-sn-glycerol-3-phosphate acyltransferase